jgi:tRNA-specific 2-thiouridylase
MPKVIVGMSGGVDSSVTAYLLREKGYEVEGVSFFMREEKGSAPACGPRGAMEETSKTALHLRIPHRTIDVRKDFEEKVIRPFVDAYISGITPNPCILCNRFIKFPYLVEEAEQRGAEYIATGHYSRVEAAKDIAHRALSKELSAHSGNHFLLKKGVDPKKDQSYVLYVLGQEVLGKLLLPLGYYLKNEIREIARALHLPASERSESQEICFIEEKSYLAFIKKLTTVEGRPGPIIDLRGRVIGSHEGIYGYTIGQRKGMGVSSPDPLYVTDIDVRNNTIYAGPREAAKKKEFFVDGINWIHLPSPTPGKGGPEALEFRASVKVRSTMKDKPATIQMVGSRASGLEGIVRVVFDEPQWAPAPGQSAVFYDGDTVIGGGVIRRSA